MRGHAVLVAFYFPPLFQRGAEYDQRYGPPSVGGLRPALLAKYLPRMGWRVTVITRAAEGLPESEQLSARLRILRLSGSVYTLGASGEHGPPPPPPPKLKVFLCQIRNHAAALATAWFGDPALDMNWLWARRAARRALRLLKHETVDVVWSTSPPEATHELGLRLATRFRSPHIADLRDGWLFEPLRTEIQTDTERRRREARLEAATVGGAARVCCASAMVAEDLARRYPAAAERVHVVRTSVDGEEFRDLPLPPPPANRPLRLVYAGRLSYSHATRTADALWKAVAQLLKADEALGGSMVFDLVGEFTSEERALPAQYGLQNVVRFLPPVARRAALELEASADACLLIAAPGHRSAIPGKAYELLAMGKPILALCEADSEPARLLSGCPQAKVVAPQDVEGIATALRKWVARKPVTTPPVAETESVPETVRQVDSLFAAVPRARSGPRP